MILRQFLHTDPVAISYLFGCGGHATCAVVDPVGDIEAYRRVADETGMRIHFVVTSTRITVPLAEHSPARREPSMCCTPARTCRFRFMPRKTGTGSRSEMS